MKKIFVNVGLLTILLVVFWFTLLARVSQPEYNPARGAERGA